MLLIQNKTSYNKILDLSLGIGNLKIFAKQYLINISLMIPYLNIFLTILAAYQEAHLETVASLRRPDHCRCNSAAWCWFPSRETSWNVKERGLRWASVDASIPTFSSLCPYHRLQPSHLEHTPQGETSAWKQQDYRSKHQITRNTLYLMCERK